MPVVWIILALVLSCAAGAAVAAMLGTVALRRAVERTRSAEQQARLASRLAEIGSMTGGLAHEIKNPLSTIGLNAQLLAEGIEDLHADPNDRARLMRRTDALRRETERLRGILEDFLEFAGELRLSLQTTSLNDSVNELVEFYRPQAQSSGVLIRAELDHAIPDCRFDPPHLKQAVLNLLLNATQALASQDTDRPREIIVRTGRAPSEQTPSLTLRVIDTGPGMSVDTQDAIFQPYFTTKSGGTGLGLPTTLRIIEAHAGTIDLHSDLGVGSEFTITLPIGGPPEESAPTAAGNLNESDQLDP